ncbi:protease inhibitor protein, partial [Streptomyces sp. SID7499]|nr:protease inhibitor protein [Streptomyces sp. SID7499]
MRRNSHAIFATVTASTLLFGGFATATAQAAPAGTES